jgi:hypothetical protein
MRRAWLGALLAIGLAAGCERAGDSPIPPAEAEQQAAPAAPAGQAAFLPSQTDLYIDGKAARFPLTIAYIVHTEPHLDLLLFTDDPPEALSARYGGNRIYLSVSAGPIRLDDLPYEVAIRAASLDRRDIPDGIFLDRDRRQLQPYDVRIAFARNSRESLMISINGHFLQFSPWENQAPTLVHVEGCFVAELKARR